MPTSLPEINLQTIHRACLDSILFLDLAAVEAEVTTTAVCLNCMFGNCNLKMFLLKLLRIILIK